MDFQKWLVEQAEKSNAIIHINGQVNNRKTYRHLTHLLFSIDDCLLMEEANKSKK